MENLLKGELIGVNVKVISSKNPYVAGIKGQIIDETKNTFLIETNGRKKRLLKEQCFFEFEFGKKKLQVDGKLLFQRPEDRLKIKVRK